MSNNPGMLASTSTTVALTEELGSAERRPAGLHDVELPVKLGPPYIKADLAGITDGHWSESSSRLAAVLRSVVAEALLCGTPRHCAMQALSSVADELEGRYLGAAPLREIMPALASLKSLECAVERAEARLDSISE